MDVEIEVLAQCNDEAADELVSTNEQTWPTEEELDAGALAASGESLPDAKKGTTPKAVRKIPKGTSAYQGAWLIDEDGDGGSEGEWSDTESDGGDKPHLSFKFSDGDGVEEKLVENEAEVPVPADEKEMEELTEEVASKAVGFEDMDLEEEAEQSVSFLLPCPRPVLYLIVHLGSDHGDERRITPRICSSRTRLTLQWISRHAIVSSDTAV